MIGTLFDVVILVSSYIFYSTRQMKTENLLIFLSLNFVKKICSREKFVRIQQWKSCYKVSKYNKVNEINKQRTAIVIQGEFVLLPLAILQKKVNANNADNDESGTLIIYDNKLELFIDRTCFTIMINISIIAPFIAYI